MYFDLTLLCKIKGEIMKKIVLIILLFALCINFVIPQTAFADEKTSINWGPSLIALGVLTVAVAIVWIVSSGSGSPKKVENPYKNGSNTATNIGINPYADKLSPYSSENQPAPLYAFKVEF